ncbi:MAG: amino acid ABC transporter permease [Coriobacteriales bacterium]|nr:amino acid ABC transporter permease [Coriobacteriales bacterium]
MKLIRMRNPFVVKAGAHVPPLKAVFNYLLVCLVVVVVFWLSFSAIDVTFDFGFIGRYRTRIIDGFLLTVGISFASLVVSLVLGIIVAMGRGARILPLRYVCDLYVRIIRGTPLIMQIYLFFYIIGTAWGIENRFFAGIMILSLFEGAYVAEIIRGSLLSLEETQLEAARAVGFTRAQIARFVIVPQLVARTLPALTGQFASIIKDSSLLSLIAVIEITQTLREISASNFRLFEACLLMGVLYLCLTLPIMIVSSQFEKRLDYES